jgi:diadenylate cyclase
MYFPDRIITMVWLQSFLSNFRFADLLDITVIAALFYGILTWLQKRASRTLIIGIVSFALLYVLARLTHMYVTLLLFQAGFTAGLVILAIVFQEEIRSAIERMLFWRSYRMKHELVASGNTIETLVSTMTSLARDRIGALCVLKGRTTLDRFISGGISLNGRLSMPLLYSIFHPKTPSHDGAVIIEADRIEKFAARLPLSHNSKEIGDRGTRHTAGLGMSEHSDALVLIVSEERGTVSIAENGRMEQVDAAKLQQRIDAFYQRIFPATKVGKHQLRLTRNLFIKLGSLTLAMLLWAILSFRTDIMSKTFTVQVEYRNVPQNWVIEAPSPAQVQVSLSGMERAFNFDPEKLAISLNMSDPGNKGRTMVIRPESMNLPQGVKVTQIIPGSVTVHGYQLEARDLPVKVITKGTLHRRLVVKEISAYPPSVRVLIAPSKNGEISRIATEPLLLETINESTTVRLKLLLPEYSRLVDETQNSVKVTVTVAQTGKNLIR